MLNKEELAILLYDHGSDFSQVGSPYIYIIDEKGYTSEYGGADLSEINAFKEAEIAFIKKLAKDEKLLEVWDDGNHEIPFDVYHIYEGLTLFSLFGNITPDQTYYTISELDEYFESESDADSWAAEGFVSADLSFTPYLEYSEDELRGFCEIFNIREKDFDSIDNKESILKELKEQITKPSS